MASARTHSEHDSKLALAQHGARVSREEVVPDPASAVRVAASIGFPVVVKLVGERLAHKSERGLVKLGLRDAASVESAAKELLSKKQPGDGEVSLLVAEQVGGSRELIVGMVRDPAFGVVVVIGAGGVTAEALGDTQMRIAPLTRNDLDDMLDSLATKAVYGEFRNQRPVNRDALWKIVDAVARVGTSRPDVLSIDVNPVIVTADGEPVVVDALVELSQEVASASPDVEIPRHGDDAFRALFDPRGVVVLGASTHPGKFGFVSLHNLLASGYKGKVAATNLSRENVLGIQTVESLDELPKGEYDLAFFCTPAAANESLIKQCAERGIKAAFVTSAGYGEADEAGKAAERNLVATAARHGILLAGPNGQGVVSTPSALCAQIVAPYPPSGSISIASQSGNFVSSFMNLARSTGVGIARAVSAGNAAAVDVADFVEWMSRDDATRVILSYVEGVTDGHRLREALARATSRKPVVMLKGGASAEGARAAASHTGAMASDIKVFDGLCRQLGVVRADTVDEAFDAAALLSTSPLPRGNRVAILTTAGGWGVVTADALSRDGVLQLAALPADVMARLDSLLPARWSRNNPVDCAGGETRDTIPAVLEVLARSSEVDAVVYLGIGIQANQARLMREGGFHPDHGLARIVDYHERQDERFATAAHELSRDTGKPILVATELAVADPNNSGPTTVQRLGGMCFASGPRAVRSLAHAYEYARHRGLGHA
ncbi:MAG: acetate--CoA ligase family protein [Ilumatobacteraceae bacterium]